MQLELYRYTLPIQTGLILRGNAFKTRQGLIIKLIKGEKIGLGEISPLPFFSTETLVQAEQQIKAVFKRLHNGENLQLNQLYPSVAFGLSCALAELNNELKIEPSSFQSVPLFKGDMGQFITQLNQMENKIGKLKVALQAPEKEAEMINQLFAQVPDLTLRLDGNRKWDWQQAVTFGKKFAKCYRSRLEFIEEPCQTPKFSQHFANEFQLPIAWDETSRESHFFVKKQQNVTAIIIKPTLIGSLEKCQNIIDQAHQQGLQAVISSSIESSLALSQLAQFSQKYTPHTLAGLDTLNLMEHQLIRSFSDVSLPLVGIESEFVERII
ncbi:o-succinylbenzoate synthase [Phocoenobacter skyensis]|uniref:o-succinylbenzoate synthase n=1 Tax=Phocoenobacter skyensis TaxID=97481 RepID=A0A1H7WAJ2_9PAST|nr:o-succinylbenzoate synthase [Pasteurella skyensis]MDP8079170.1 o-succinylbenzoate synthase [Pasteurella skyensis]MDP8085120.1 o-succinylbenzoate synthase [Pasteurella skyensis]MDP8170107.1 o-succinylbenzoate synthase [Pasteurella skyensis]MDP8174289.1 o-succinylbenzoate synthase [Pasteurella skyensis]MDP8184984.1 o-succinylbenzoate synthase [Pasteurella skyensis]